MIDKVPSSYRGARAAQLSSTVRPHGMSRRDSGPPTDPAKRLLGSWRSDRFRTLEFWGFPRSMPPGTKRLLRARDCFGHLEWHVTPKRIRFVHEGKSHSAPYSVVWKDKHRLIIRIGGKSDANVRDIHFDGESHFYMLVARANCEFFRKVRSNTSLERTREG